MAASTATNIGLQYAWALGEDGWNTGMDSNLLKLDSLVQPNVIDSTLTTPPGSPTTGDKYIVATGGTGSWNALDAKVVIWSGSAWVSYTAKEGWMVYDQTNNYYLKFNGSAWVEDPFGDRAYADSLVTGLWDSQVDRDFEDFRNLGETASHFAANMRSRVSAMTIATPSNAMTLADISGASGTSGWMRCYTGALGAGAIGYITEYFGYSPIAASASKEFVWAGSLDTLPTDTTTTDAVVRVGFGGYTANVQTNPVAQALASAYFQVDKGGYWKCFSGKTGATENTTTGVATAAMTYVSLRIIVAATTGVVSFYINGTLVATHSGVGACPYEQQWFKFVSVYNQGAGTIASSSSSGPGAVFFDAWGSAIKLASDRTNLRFLT